MLRIVQIGCGKMSMYTMRYVYERGGSIVAAYDVDKNVIGKDISAVMGGPERGVAIQAAGEMGHTLGDAKADCAIITTRSLIAELEESFTICANYGVNAISICEECFYPWTSNPEVTARLDKLAKENNCTFSGSGYQDVSWGSMVTALCATAGSIRRIHGRSSYNLDDYGMATATVHGAGLSPEDFEKEIVAVNNVRAEDVERCIREGIFLPSFMWSVNSWLAAALGLNVTAQSQKSILQSHCRDLESKTLGRVIPQGYATGLSAVVVTETKEGVVIECECIGKVFAPDEIDINQWSIEGEPDMSFVMERPATIEMTCACVVNRIPDVMAAVPGYVTTDKMPALQFCARF